MGDMGKNIIFLAKKIFEWENIAMQAWLRLSPCMVLRAGD